MSAIQIEVSRTRGDILKGIFANTLRSPGALASYLIGALIVAAIAIAVNTDEPLEVMIATAAIVFVGMLGVYSIILGLCALLAARKSWASPGSRDPVKYTFSDEGLGVEATVGHGTSSWITWKTAFETKSLIVIRHQLNLLHVIPKRGLSADVLNSVRSILKRHLKNARLYTENAA